MQIVWPAPILAADWGEEAIALVIFLISILSWLINTIRSASADKNVPPPRPANADRPQQPKQQLQNEIDVFLREVGAKNKPQQAGAERRLPAAPRQPPEPPRRARQPLQRSDSQTAVKPAQSPPQREQRKRSFEERKSPVSTELGKEVRTHVSQYMQAERLPTHAASGLGQEVVASVADHLGKFTAITPAPMSDAPPPPVTAANTIASMLRNPNSVRQAILINEVLARPKALRK